MSDDTQTHQDSNRRTSSESLYSDSELMPQRLHRQAVKESLSRNEPDSGGCAGAGVMHANPGLTTKCEKKRRVSTTSIWSIYSCVNGRGRTPPAGRVGGSISRGGHEHFLIFTCMWRIPLSPADESSFSGLEAATYIYR